MYGRAIAALMITSLSACFVGFSPAAKHAARRDNLEAIGVGFAIGMACILASLAVNDPRGEDDTAGMIVAGMGAFTGLTVMAAGAGGLALNAIVPNKADPDDSE